MRRALVLSALALTLLFVGAACAEPHGHARGPRVWEGAPPVAPGMVRGYFVWHDDAGWHVRWTTKGAQHRFSGRVTCDGAFEEFRPISADRGDFIRRVDRRTASFDTVTGGGTDGFDFRPSQNTRGITFDLSIDGYRIVPAEVFLGQQMVHAASNPFTLRR